ncbi:MULTISPECIES: hypothetical protein [Methylobacteriaceae]|uniref:hypothetical protein n=1 Tax=Methylobacteriaceae TaxID=119045 RepID=UPI001075D0FD|nr:MULTISPECIES: hypothetical protein [Methylobacteriaceae]TFZ55121.1 hypothetical protein E4V01_23490 [Methylorubrum sp. Q1]
MPNGERRREAGMARPPRFEQAVAEVRVENRCVELWMEENFAALHAAYPSGRLNLRELSEVVRRCGLTNSHGGRLTDATLSKTWARVRQRMLTAAPSPRLEANEVARGVVTLPWREAELRPEPASPVDRIRTPATVQPRAQPAAAQGSAAEQIARLRAEQRAGRPPMPTSVDLASPAQLNNFAESIPS